MLAQVVANQTWRSYEPIQIIKDAHTLQYVMENIIADFQYLKQNNTTPLEELKTRVANGRYWNNDTLRNDAAVEATAIESCFQENSSLSGNFSEPESCSSTDIPILKVIIRITGTQHQMEAFFAY